MVIKKVSVTRFECKCERCGHEWLADVAPLRCAKCKTPYWNKPKKQKSGVK